MAASLKGPGIQEQRDGSGLRIAIVHARWNTTLIEALIAGAKKSLRASGVKEENIVLESVPGSYELPLAVQRVYAASQVQSAASAVAGGIGSLASGIGDLLGGSNSTTDLHGSLQPSPSRSGAPQKEDTALKQAFDAIIAVGVLIKGESMHFEYISDAVSHGLMKVQLDTGVPVVFGLLTLLSEEQGLARAGLDGGTGKEAKGHNHGEDWGNAAVELGVKRKAWSEGRLGL